MATKRDKKHQAEIIQAAVSDWFRFYEIQPDGLTSEMLIKTAVEYFDDGLTDAADLSAALIGNFSGILWTRVNAPTSISIH